MAASDYAPGTHMTLITTQSKRQRFCFLLAFLALLAIFSAQKQAFAAKAGLAPGLAETKDAIVEILASEDRLPGHLQRVRKTLTTYYIDNDAPVYWVGTGRMTPFIQRLLYADEDGLKLEDYPADYLIALRDTIDASDPVSAGYTELAFAAYFLRYAADLKTGRFIPSKIDPKLFQPRRKLDEINILETLNGYNNPEQYLDQLEPHNPHYRALRAMLRKYRALAANGGWPSIPMGVTLKPGMSDPRIPAIRDRLVQAGDMLASSVADPELYDPALALAVEQYQRRHGLNDEGIIGKLTLTQMNIPAEERVRQIIVNMERWRWMPEDMGNRHMMVNIAAFELQRVNSGSVVQRIPVVVGKPYHQTPVFSDQMEYLEFNPTWTVPYSIATKEMLPKLRNNPNALGPNFELLASGQTINFSSVDFNQYNGSNFPFTIRQRPGEKNALGQVKFMFPNKHAIYLHDTPSRSLFHKDARAFSHGCVRVYKPIELAKKVLADVPDWTPKRIQQTLASAKTTRVVLPAKIPVHIVYATAFRGEGGSVEFRPDIYGRDKKLYRALFGKPTS